jgi:hypothetical protein
LTGKPKTGPPLDSGREQAISYPNPNEPPSPDYLRHGDFTNAIRAVLGANANYPEVIALTMDGRSGVSRGGDCETPGFQG